jgi:hypothetical protein
MKALPAKYTSIPALFLCCLVVVSADAVFAQPGYKQFASSPVVAWQEAWIRRDFSTGTSRNTQELKQQEEPTRKRRALHEYGPDTVFYPDERNAPGKKLKSEPVQQPKVKNERAVKSGAAVKATTAKPTVKITPKASPRAVKPELPSAKMTPSQPAPLKKAQTPRWMLSSGIVFFLFVLGALVFVLTKLVPIVKKLVREAYKGRQSADALTLQEPPMIAKMQQSHRFQK